MNEAESWEKPSKTSEIYIGFRVTNLQKWGQSNRAEKNLLGSWNKLKTKKTFQLKDNGMMSFLQGKQHKNLFNLKFFIQKKYPSDTKEKWDIFIKKNW